MQASAIGSSNACSNSCWILSHFFLPLSLPSYLFCIYREDLVHTKQDVLINICNQPEICFFKSKNCVKNFSILILISLECELCDSNTNVGVPLIPACVCVCMCVCVCFRKGCWYLKETAAPPVHNNFVFLSSTPAQTSVHHSSIHGKERPHKRRTKWMHANVFQFTPLNGTYPQLDPLWKEIR